jgi:putative transcriptional regulator
MINHHPPFEMLFEYATGMLTEGVALAAATHAAMCPTCRSAIGQLETVGGVLLEEIEPEAVGKDLLAAVLDKLDEPEARPTSAADALDEATRELIPPPLRGYLGRSLSDLAWRSIGWMCQEVRLPLASKGVRASLIRLGPGSPMPKHSHRGHEYTVVLAGGYKDAGEQFARGDFDVKEAADLHQPVADQDGECIGLVVLDAPVRLTGLGGRLINPFLRI